MRDWKTLQDGEVVDDDADAGITPGKQTLTMGMRAPHERPAGAVVAGASAGARRDTVAGRDGGAVQGKSAGASVGGALAARYVQRFGAPRRAVQRTSANGASAGSTQGGQDVRPARYVTLWPALGDGR